MRKRLVGIAPLVAAAGAMAMATPAGAGTFLAFGPETYERVTGPPITVTRSFSVLDPSAPYLIRVRNGGLEDEDAERVSSTVIKINGVQVIGPSDLNQNVIVVERPVTLLASNQIEVEVRGRPGGRLIVEVEGTDNSPPIITATADPLANSAGWNKTDVVVSFTCQDTSSGVASCPLPITVIGEGMGQAISGTATDRAGNSSTATVEISIDKTAPSVTPELSPPANPAGWNNTDVTVTFRAEDALSGVAGVTSPVTVTSEGAFQEVAGTATDRAGNTAPAVTSVSIDKTAPVVLISEPTEGTVKRVPRVQVAGTASDANGLTSITVGGVAAGASSPFEALVLLQQEGPQTIVATAQDVAGNAGSASVGIFYTTPPVVEITSPADLSAVGSTPVTVSGTVDDPQATVLVGVEAIPAVVTGNNFTATGVPLREGGNVITAVGRDVQGNAGTDSITVVLDTTAPRVMIDSPPNGSVATSPTLTVTGRVNDLVLGTINSPQAQVKVNGMPAAVAQRTFVVEGVPLSPGPNTITAEARDAVGNVDTTQISVILDTTAAARINVVSGNGQTAGIGEPLPQPLVVSVTDQGNAPIPGRTVIFRVSENNGFLLDSGDPVRGLVTTTDAEGKAQAQYVLGSRAGAGNNRVEVTAQGVPGAAVFTISALTHPPAKINVDAGSNQKGAVGQPLPHAFVAVVTDEGHNRLASVPVTFSVSGGEGDFNGEGSVVVNTDSDGRALAVLTLGPSPGIENNVVKASVENLSGLPAGFVASGLEPADPAQTRISGLVLDNSNVPIPGVTLRIRGTALAVASNAQGQFTLSGVPVGDVHLQVDGSTAQRPGTWPDLDFELVTVAGANNTLGMPIYLLPLDTGRGIFVDETHGGTLTLPDHPGFSLTVLPNSATFPDGTRRGTITVTAVHADKVPMVPNFGQQPRFIVTIQPPGVRFDPPAQVSHPNVDGLAPGEVTELYSFDHDMGSFVATGTATVSEDGSVLRSNAGTGIIKGGWHCGGNPTSSGGSGSLSLTLSPKPIKLQYGGTTQATGKGKPPLDAVYGPWTLTNKTFDITVEFGGQPTCPNQTSCQNTLRTRDLINDDGNRNPSKTCGTADVDLTFTCTKTGKSVKDKARLEVGCAGKSAADCVSACQSAPARGMCGTPCSLMGVTPGAFGNACWSVRVGGTDYCYWDYMTSDGGGFQNLCCPNHCDQDSAFTQWGQQGPGLRFKCTVIVPCPGQRIGTFLCVDAN